MLHVTEKKVTYIETTQLKAVYFSTFLQYFGLGIEEFFNSLGIPVTELIEKGIYFAILESFCRYFSFARYGDILEIHTQIKELKRKTIKFESEIYEKSSKKILANGYSVWVTYDRNKKSTEIPKEILSALKKSLT